jgi:hypothetical protein
MVAPVAARRLPLRRQATAARCARRHKARGLAIALLTAVALLATPSSGLSNDSSAGRLDELLTGFAEAALRMDDGRPAKLRRWPGPIKLRLRGERAADFAPSLLQQLELMASAAGLGVVLLPVDGGPPENLLVTFEAGSGYKVAGRDAGCYTRVRYDDLGLLLHADIRVNTRHAGRNGACAAHELMHALGLPGHPERLRSVLNLTRGIVAATEEDLILLRLLYAPDVELGQSHATTLAQAHRALARLLGTSRPMPD